MKFPLFGRQISVDESNVRLTAILFAVVLIARGTALSRGFAIDDYQYMDGIRAIDVYSLFMMGRFLIGVTVWAIEALGANISDLYLAVGFVALLLQAVLVVTILRFVGMDKSPSAGLVGALMVAHPYLTEAITFREGLPGYCVVIVLTILALEAAMKSPATWQSRAFSLLATFAMLLTYQMFLNYLAVVIIFSFFFGGAWDRTESGRETRRLHADRAILLAIVSAIATAAFLVVMKLYNSYAEFVIGSDVSNPRSHLISRAEIPLRMEEVSSALSKMYWDAEPIFPGFPKAIMAVLLAIAIATIVGSSLTKRPNNRGQRTFLATMLALILAVPASIGVIITFKDWWPVPRVFAHVPIICGLLFLAADGYSQGFGNDPLKKAITAGRWVVLVAFIFLSNQILGDQQRMNQWDRMMANRIVSRLEQNPRFDQIASVHFYGDPLPFAATLRTIQGDMNTSAFLPTYSRIPLLNEVSGYKFIKADDSTAAIGNKFCASRRSWPHADSVSIEGSVAIVCFTKRNDINRNRLLIDAAWQGDIERVALYLDEQADVNFVSVASGSLTPLTAAVSQRHHEVATMLLERGANPNLVLEDGSSALIEATWQHDLSLVSELVARGADVSFRRPRDGVTAIAIAKAHGQREIVKVLREAGAKD